MTTLHELGQAVIEMREAVNMLWLGNPNSLQHNCEIVIFCNKRANEIIEALNEACKTAQPGEIEIVPEEQTQQEVKDHGDHCRKPAGD